VYLDWIFKIYVTYILTYIFGLYMIYILARILEIYMICIFKISAEIYVIYIFKIYVKIYVTYMFNIYVQHISEDISIVPTSGTLGGVESARQTPCGEANMRRCRGSTTSDQGVWSFGDRSCFFFVFFFHVGYICVVFNDF